jgi:dihydrofolate synthase/folylpolyglutamate synthase
VTLIVGMLGRKDAGGFFGAFADLAPRVIATGFDSPSATPAETLARAAAAQGLRAEAADGVEDALARAVRTGGAVPHVVICGSLHFIGEVLAMSPETWPS